MKPEKENNILRVASLVAVIAFAGNSIVAGGIMIAERDDNNRLDSQLSSLLPSVDALRNIAGKKPENVGGDINLVRKELTLEEQKVADGRREPSHKGMTIFGLGVISSIIFAVAIRARTKYINAKEASAPSSS